ncbi:DUF2242 domain-containing protein [Oxalicibacterium solurbis]|uniref:DUF2242 domain-containing protein n=1 Tax=Oxalicibacterium solurbis TaxID=69280 RepID=A0A8J3B4G5_9BURK|nr:DUF2242 domain-containing protein [Oxalicibacterium solurbis]GGI54923.1 hypothetical protein GCM10011430_20970 [Oxalicibacterium solurbis]
MQSSTRILLSALLLTVAACSSAPPAVYTEEKFDSTNIYSRRFEVSSTVACEAVRRTLLSQGYVIVTSSANQVTSSKSFQPRDDAHVQISFRVVCTDDDAKGDKSSIYVNALEDRYALKKVNNVASLGVGVLGSVSLPFSSSDDSLVKVASETISSDKFYSRFFYLVERFLDNATIEDEDDDHLTPPGAPKPAPAERPVTTMPSSATPETPVATTPTAAAVPAVAVVSPSAAAVSAPVPAPAAAAAHAAPLETAAASISATPASQEKVEAATAPTTAPIVATTSAATATAPLQTVAVETAASHAAETPAPTAASSTDVPPTTASQQP